MGGDPIRHADPWGLITVVVVTSDYGIGSHAAVYTSRGFERGPALYDPAGNYPGMNPNIDTRGSGDFFAGDDANLADYLKWQRSTGLARQIGE